MWTTIRTRFSPTSYDESSLRPLHHQFSLGLRRRSTFLRSFIRRQYQRSRGGEEGGVGDEVEERERAGGESRNLAYRRRKQRGGNKMKWRTASERQHNLERQFGTKQFHCGGRLGNSLLHSLYWRFRRLHYWLCFYDEDIEIDIEELIANPFNTQPPSLDELQRLTGFRREWIMFLYRNFKQLCPNGRMTESQWRTVFRLIFRGATDFEYADRAFTAIAGGNRSQHILTFEDLIFCLHDLVAPHRDSDLTTPNGFDPRTDTSSKPSIPSQPLVGAVESEHPHQLHQHSPPQGEEQQEPASCETDTGIKAADRNPEELDGGLTTVASTSRNSNVRNTNSAQFTFQLMRPDEEGRVDIGRFLRYTRCVYRLSASSAATLLSNGDRFSAAGGDSKSPTYRDSNTLASMGFGASQGANGGGSSDAGASSSSCRNSSIRWRNAEGGKESKRERRGKWERRSTKAKTSTIELLNIGGSGSRIEEGLGQCESALSGMPPWLMKLAKEQFTNFDKDNDGYITISDVEGLFNSEDSALVSFLLRTESQLELTTTADESE